MHEMLREIAENSSVLKRMLEADEAVLERVKALAASTDLIYCVGSGSSYNSALFLQTCLAKAGKCSIAVRSSEFRELVSAHRKLNACAIIFSQSGESLDAVVAQNESWEKGIRTVAVTNNGESTLSREADVSFLLRAGVENAVAATKTLTAQMAAALLFLDKFTGSNHRADLAKISEWSSNLDSLYRFVSDYVEAIGDHVVLLGDLHFFPVALEGALKLSETGNVFTEAYPVREYLHGHMQTVSSQTAIIIVSAGESYQPEEKLFRKFTDRIFHINRALYHDPALGGIAKESVALPLAIILQVIAYRNSLKKGLNPDRPEKLSKVVRN